MSMESAILMEKIMPVLSVKPFTGHIIKLNVINMGIIFRVEIYFFNVTGMRIKKMEFY